MLARDATIAVVGPSGVHDPKRLEASWALVESWGYRLVPGPHLGAVHRYLGGTHEGRQADLNWALTDPDIDAVWFVRGGYGTVHLLDGVPWREVVEDRPVVGFSDATALFSAMRATGRGLPIHGPVLHSLADLPDEKSQNRLQAVLSGSPQGHWPIDWLSQPTEVEAPIVGGNLCVLTSLVGTPWQLNTSGAIVLLEEIAEPPYKVDRMLHQLIAGGGLDGAQAVVLGEFRNCDPPDKADYALQDVLVEGLAGLGLPLAMGLPVGHGPQNHALVLGARASLTEDGLDVG